MSRKKVYIEVLNSTEISMLKEGWKNGKSHDFRNRCQCILMSNQGYDAQSLSEIFSVTKHTIYEWIRNWKKAGIIGLIRVPGQGRKPKLSIDNELHIKVVEISAKNAAENGINMKDEILEKIEIEGGLSQRTLRRFLKKKVMPTRGFVGLPKKHLTQKT